MSTRGDIKDGSQAETAKYGLVYTCKSGWVDVGHAAPGAAQRLWNAIKDEKGERSPDGQWFKVPFEECMGVKKWGVSIISVCEGEDFGLRVGMSVLQKESAALAIFLKVSMQFETMQGTFPYSLKTSDSSFSVEDLVSNLIGFYRAVRPRSDYVSQCGPVSLKAALAVWDQSGAVGTHKNREAKAVLFPCAECAGAPTAKMVSDLPPHLSAIKPDPAGKLWKRWPDIISPRVSATTPPVPGGAQPPKSAVMGANDTLSIISQREYKEKRQPELLWPIIHDANPAFGPNPNIVKSGFPLAIPDIRQFNDIQLDEFRRRGLNWRNWGK